MCRACTWGQPPHITSVDDAWQGMDWFLSGRTSANGLWTEDWFQDFLSENWSYLADVLRSGAALGTQRFGGYVVGSQIGSHPSGASYKLLSLIGQGAKIVDVYAFGPNFGSAALVPNQNYWADNQSAYKPVAEAIGRIGRAESVLYPGKSTRSMVAVQLPGASALWFPISQACAKGPSVATCPSGDDEFYSLESQGLYYALQHAGYSVDFVDDTGMATQGLLDRYKVLYVTQPNISTQAQQRIYDWVSAGGTVVATAGAGVWDEYNTPSPGGAGTLLGALGLNPPVLTGTTPWTHLRDVRINANMVNLVGSAESGNASNLVNESFSANIRQVGGTYQFPAGLVRLLAAPLSPIEPGDVVAQFTGPGTGSATAPAPAVTVHKCCNPSLKGTAIAYGFFPGTEYFSAQEQLSPDRLPTHWDPDARTRAVTPVLQAPMPVARRVYANTPLVETLRLDSSAGSGIVVLNWNARRPSSTSDYDYDNGRRREGGHFGRRQPHHDADSRARSPRYDVNEEC